MIIGRNDGLLYAYENTGSGAGVNSNTLFGLAVNADEKLRVNGNGDMIMEGLLDLNNYLDLDYNGSTAAATITQAGAGNILDLYDGATKVLTVIDGGNVGIGGITSPGYELAVSGDIYATNDIYADNFYGNIPEGQGFYAAGWVDDGSIVRLETQTDNVGIGKTDPQSKLDVSGTVTSTGLTSTGQSYFATTSGNVGIGTSTVPARLTLKGTGTGASTQALRIQDSDGTNRVTILDNGNLGI